MTRFRDQAVLFLATGGGFSLLPNKLLLRTCSGETHGKLQEKKWTGAGLVGSIEGVLTYLIFGPSWWSIGIMTIAVFAAVYIAGEAEKIFRAHDDARIVVDEWIGALIAVYGIEPKLGWPLLIGCLFFRFFDVLKGPHGRALQRLPGGWGVVMDDVAAGLLANLCLRGFLSFGWLG